MGTLSSQRCVIAGLPAPLRGPVAAHCRELGAEVFLAGSAELPLDVLSAASWAEALRDLAGGAPTALVQGLSANPEGSLLDLTLEEFRSSNESNLEAVFLGTQAAFSTMQAGGAIVNVFATCGRRGSASQTALGSASGGLEIHTRASAIEGAQRQPQIRANGLALEGALWGPRPDPQQIAAAAAGIAFLISEASGYTTGSTLIQDGGRLGVHR